MNDSMVMGKLNTTATGAAQSLLSKALAQTTAMGWPASVPEHTFARSDGCGDTDGGGFVEHGKSDAEGAGTDVDFV